MDTTPRITESDNVYAGVFTLAKRIKAQSQDTIVFIGPIQSGVEIIVTTATRNLDLVEMLKNLGPEMTGLLSPQVQSIIINYQPRNTLDYKEQTDGKQEIYI